jgi:hypothetical protein
MDRSRHCSPAHFATALHLLAVETATMHRGALSRRARDPAGFPQTRARSIGISVASGDGIAQHRLESGLSGQVVQPPNPASQGIIPNPR